MRTVVLATRNLGKIREMQMLLADLPVTLISAADLPDAPEVEEDGLMLYDNALKKARTLYDFFGGQWALADDTGLMVTALGGAPGVYSARYAGENCTPRDNRQKLLQNLNGQADRSASFRTVIVLFMGDSLVHFEGVCDGHITRGERGTRGFGYDAIFVPQGMKQTFAELEADKKNAVSHRGRAMRKCYAYLRQNLLPTP